MRPVSFVFLAAIFGAEASVNRDAPQLKAARQAFGPPRNALHVTPLLRPSDGCKKAREEAVVEPFVGDVKSYAGYFTVNKEYRTNLHFWFFPSEKDHQKAPLILWLHGGPAESSTMAVFEENGPYKLVDGKVALRELSWTKHYNVLYLESTIGSGYSYTLSDYDGFPYNIYEAVYCLYKALVQFYKMFPEYEKNAFYMAGQSYGGKYIPVLAARIHAKNNETGNLKINLKGMMMGGSNLDPVNQIAYGHFVYEYGLVDMRARDRTLSNDVRARVYIDSRYTYYASDELHQIRRRLREAGYPIPLDVNDPELNTTAIYQVVEDFVTREDVREQIHAGDVRFHNRKSILWYTEYNQLNSVGRELSNLVQLGYKVLLYSGQYDMATPPEQMDRAIASLLWTESEKFRKAKVEPWYSHGELAGYKKSHANLQQVFVRKANHMIVRSQPKWMLELLRSFAV